MNSKVFVIPVYLDFYHALQLVHYANVIRVCEHSKWLEFVVEVPGSYIIKHQLVC